MILSPSIIVILVVSGLVVGFVNTLAGGGSAISLTVFMALGLPVHVANGTNRIAIVMQNLSSTATFTRKGMLDWRSGLRLGIPTIVGTIAGAQIAVTIDERIFQICFVSVMAAVLIFTLAGDKIFKRTGRETRKFKPLHYLVFLLIGVYSGYIFVGTGYFVLLAAMGLLHMSIVHSNVMKNFIILLSVPFSLLVFLVNGDVSWTYGLIHGVGNMAGAFVASHWAIGWGTKFLKWFMVGVVVVCIADVAGLISIRALVLSVI